MKIKAETISFSIWSVVLVSRILISLDNSLISSPLSLYYGSSIVLIAWIVFIKIKTQNFLKRGSFLFWGSAFCVYLILFGKILVNENLKSLTAFTFNAMAVFYILVFIMAAYIDNEHKKNMFVKVSFWTLVVGVFFSALINWDGKLQGTELISNIFQGYTRERSAFGFYHPNTVANIALCVIILSAYLMKENGRKKHYIVIDAFMIYIILAASSRTTLSAVILFLILVLYETLLKKIRNKNERRFWTAILSIIVILLLMFSSENGIEGLFKLSNRSYNFIYNIPVLANSGRFMIGLGLIGSGEFYQLAQYNTFFVDNYFLYILMSTGVIGLLFIASFMIYLCKRLFVGSSNVPMKRLTLIVFIVNVFASLGETCFMYPSFASCFVYTTLYIAYACHKEVGRNKDKKI